jgi:hypothetical protein
METLIPITCVAPTAQNPLHRIADTPRIFAEYCRQHEIDAQLLPVAHRRGWPDFINYAELPARVKDFMPTLQDVLESLDCSEFFTTAVDLHAQMATFNKFTA